MPRFRIDRVAPTEVRSDVLALPVFKGPVLGPGVDRVERALGASFADLLGAARCKGEPGDALAVPTLGRLPAKQVLLVGLGERRGAGPDAARKAGAVVARRAGAAATVATTIPEAVRGPAPEAAAAFAEGWLLGSYRFERYKASDGARPATKEIVLLARRAGDARAVLRAIERAEVLAEATALARDLTNTPAGDFGPESFAAEARRIARGLPLSVRVLTEKELRAGGFGGLLGVGQGSARPPVLVEIRYRPPSARRHVALVGKGITFDSGGINLKTEGLDWMKMDMAGGAAVLATMAAVGRLRPKVAVTGIVCAAENMPGGSALRPGDVIRIHGGKSVEIGNTDAEGRLVMADGIVYAIEHGAEVVVDVATLTGACMIALGPKAFGVMGNRQREVDQILRAAARAGERAWQLPLYDDYRKQLDSDVADLKNIGDRYGGAITAGLFLREFAGDTPWVHLDIAGPARSTVEEFETPKGATGAGVRTLVRWIESL
jgi:leucyl aminopeptidase